ncbi:MAG TPA: molybdopterin cofactor-binding domain-containing protein [Bryobacteraceae bacterium]|nr:molybdopterin cofactor-binding domain-containing protein [Bryobacteraceae bacterium]
MLTHTQTTNLSRRDLLRTGGTLIVSFAFGGARLARAQSTPANAGSKPLDPKELDSFVAVHADGSVTLYCGKVDVGTGLRIAVRQMAAEELGVAVDRISLVEGDTGLTPDQGSTGGSTGLTRGGSEIRQAAATARQALIAMGAGQLKRPASELVLSDGQVRPVSGGAGVGIGTLLGDRRFSLKVDSKAALKKPAEYAVVGKPLPRPDIPAKCTGREVYVQDFTMPGMLHGRVIRPASFGAKLVSVDESSIRAIPDVKVVRVESFLGVVAKDEWAAVRAARELKVVWSEWTGLPGNDGLERFLREGEVQRDEIVVNKGDPGPALASAAKQFSASYFWPNQSHGSIGPSCAVADVHDGGATVWTSTQGPHALRQNIAKFFGFPEAKVRTIFLDGAGSYGGNGNDDVAADAVLLSKSVSAPVRVQWMRQDEHGWDPKGPQQLLDMRAGVDAQGRIVAWDAQMWLPASVPGNRPYPALDAAGMSQDHGQGAGLLSQNADPPYYVASDGAKVRVTAHWLKQTPLRPSNLRAPGKIANVFAVEAFTDELAAAAGMDPVDYRLRGMNDPRAIEVLKTAAEMIGWQSRTSPNPRPTQGNLRIGRGIAYARYKQAENYVALALEAAVDPAIGRIAVRRITCAHDCGLVVNPDALRNQIEGSILQTLSRTLHEEVKFDRSRVTSVDWVSYPVLRFPEVPAVDVKLIDRPEQRLYGAGEAACVTVPAAVANAVFDATGVRLRTAPFTPERVKAALGALRPA